MQFDHVYICINTVTRYRTDPSTQGCCLLPPQNPPPQHLAATNLFSSFIILRILYKWNHAVCDLVRSAFVLSIVPVRCARVVACIIFVSFMPSTHSVMYHNLTIFPLEGHSGFWFGAVTNKAAVNISDIGFLVWILAFISPG